MESKLIDNCMEFEVHTKCSIYYSPENKCSILSNCFLSLFACGSVRVCMCMCDAASIESALMNSWWMNIFLCFQLGCFYKKKLKLTQIEYWWIEYFMEIQSNVTLEATWITKIPKTIKWLRSHATRRLTAGNSFERKKGNKSCERLKAMNRLRLGKSVPKSFLPVHPACTMTNIRKT